MLNKDFHLQECKNINKFLALYGPKSSQNNQKVFMVESKILNTNQQVPNPFVQSKFKAAYISFLFD